MEHWTQERYDAFRRELYAQQEEAYRQFHTKLLRSDLPVIGLRAPLLRKIAAEIAKEDGVDFCVSVAEEPMRNVCSMAWWRRHCLFPMRNFCPIATPIRRRLSKTGRIAMASAPP